VTWTLLFCCLALSFLVSGTEAGILSLNRLRVRHLARQKNKDAIQLQQMLEKPARLLVTALIVTSFLNIAALILLANMLVSWLGWAGYYLTLLVALPLFLIGIEMLPKSIFQRLPYQTLAAFSIPLETVSMLLSPLIFIGSLFAKYVLHLHRPRQIFVAREDLKYVTTEIERMGMLSSFERQMIHNVVDFRNVRVADVMVRYSDVISVHPETPVEELLKLSRSHGFDRYPVVDAANKILGVCNVFDLIVDRPSVPIAADFLRRILTVRPEDRAPSVLRRLRASPQRLAAVVDEFGQTVGIVSAEDLLNPLVKAPTVSG
jgi:putative hemolysin